MKALLLLILLSTTYKKYLNPTFYWQLQGDIRRDIDAKYYDIDMFDNSKELISALKSDGKIVICYINAGAWENWREDSNEFKIKDIGKSLDGWEGERWLDIRSESVREIMQKRLDLAKAKGCDGVEFDNVDGYLNDTGFSLTYEEQLKYNRFLAKEAKKRGMFAVLKNDIPQLEELVDYFDMALNEECFKYGECENYEVFIQRGKVVFNVEYDDYFKENFSIFCQEAKKLKIHSYIFPASLDGSFVYSCDYGVKK